MVVIRYKPLFSLSVSYELASLGILTDGISISAAGESAGRMNDFRLKPQYKKNSVTIYYEGIEKPAGVPVTSEPLSPVSTDQYFYFLVDLSGRERIRGLQFHASAAEAKATGFPVLYDAAISVLNGPPVITRRSEIKVVSPVFTWTVVAADTGIAANTAVLELRDEDNAVVDLEIPPAKLNDKSVDGAGAIPEFSFTVDASRLQPGIYEFKTGTFTKKLFIATRMDITQCIALVRVLKNEFLGYKTNLADNSFTRFDLMIPKV